jgi:putative transposase
VQNIVLVIVIGMSQRKFTFSEGEFYHVYNRGNSKQVIFNSHNDHTRFMRILYLSNSHTQFKIKYLEREEFIFEQGQPLVAIGAYCLMPNHFHILVTPLVEGGVSKFMQKLTTGYSMYYNNKYERTGTLFEGKFKARWVDSDQYLKYLYAYIHLNPVKLIDPTWKEEGIKDPSAAFDFAISYKYSSLKDYLETTAPKTHEKEILNKTRFPDYFTTETQIKAELFEWLNYAIPIL